MNLRLEEVSVSFIEVPFKKGFSLSQNRKLVNLRERWVQLKLSETGSMARGAGNIFDSTQWAHPLHLHPHAQTETDLDFFEKGSIHLEESLKGSSFAGLFAADQALTERALAYANDFQRERNYALTPIMPMMLAAPFSVALFSAYEQLSGHPFFGGLQEAPLRTAFEAFIRYKTGFEAKQPTAQKLTEIPWLMTLDLGSELEELEKTIAQFQPRQIKVKLDSDPTSVTAVLQKMSFIRTKVPASFYVDCNQSYTDLASFKEIFLKRAESESPDVYRAIRGIEEPTGDPFGQSPEAIRGIGFPIYIDENNATIEDADRLTQLGYNLVLKLTRPLGTLLAQHQIALARGRACTVQDLTFAGPAYFANLGLFEYVRPAIGFETNYGLFVEADWGENLPPAFARQTRIEEGRIPLKEDYQKIFPSLLGANVV